MFEKTKKFVSDHKSEINTALVTAAVVGLSVHLYNKKHMISIDKKLFAKMGANPEIVWAGIEWKGIDFAMTAIDKTKVVATP